MSNNSVAIASDHAGFALKQSLVDYMRELDLKVKDLGTDSDDSVDYPDFAVRLAEYMKENNETVGVLICGSGIGMSIAVNRFSFIRAALVRSMEEAVLCRQHNDANVLVLGGRITSEDDARHILNAFLNTEFSGGRHIARVEKLSLLNDDVLKKENDL